MCSAVGESGAHVLGALLVGVEITAQYVGKEEEFEYHKKYKQLYPYYQPQFTPDGHRAEAVGIEAVNIFQHAYHTILPFDGKGNKIS